MNRATAKACLLVTDEFEPTADQLVLALGALGVRVVRWNLDRFPVGSSLSFSLAGGESSMRLATGAASIDLEEVGSVWCRGFKATGFPGDLSQGDRQFAEVECQRAMDALLALGDATWVNHPEAFRRASSKPAQLAAASAIGLQIPRTLISNDPDAILAWIRESHAPVVYKTLSQFATLEAGRSVFTTRVTEELLRNIDEIVLTPGIFQEEVPKSHELRVTVVGTRSFVGRINSQARPETGLDWRHRPFEIESEPARLPPDLESRVQELMRHFGLRYAALDFIVTPEGAHVFLEINPAGQYMWVEARTGMPITAELAKLLAG